MTVTRKDLRIVDTTADYLVQRDVVEYDGNFYTVASCNMTNAQPEDLFLQFLFNLPDLETYVMPSVWDADTGEYVPKNECNESCSTGMCTKRIFSDETTANIDLGYAALVDYLNA